VEGRTAMDNSSKYLMLGGGVLAMAVAAVVSLILARQPAATVVVPAAPAPIVGAASAVLPQVAPVLITTQQIKVGTTIAYTQVASLFTVRYEPKAVVNLTTVFSDPAQLTALLKVVPRQTTVTLAKGEQLTALDLSGLSAPTTINTASAAIPRGHDAESLVVVPTKAANGVIAVNDHVDVIYSVPVKPGVVIAGTEPDHSNMLIEDATVVAAQPMGNTYTLALQPQDAIRLAHVQDAGWSLHLVLRSVLDVDTYHPIHRSIQQNF